jgi:hypothetical protein
MHHNHQQVREGSITAPRGIVLIAHASEHTRRFPVRRTGRRGQFCVLKGAVLSGRQPILILSNLYIQIRSGTRTGRFVFPPNRDCRAGPLPASSSRLPLKLTLPVLPVRQQIVTSTTSSCLHVSRRRYNP